VDEERKPTGDETLFMERRNGKTFFGTTANLSSHVTGACSYLTTTMLERYTKKS
jgi:hypothetical protein